MFESPSQSEESVKEVPAYIFSEDWMKSNFVVEKDKTIREETKREYKSFVEHKVMDLEENREIKEELLRRIDAIQGYNTKW